jgi:hypothetical protein
VEKALDFIAKRKYPRRRYRQPVGILHRGKFWLTRGEEIGEGGLLVNSDRPIAQGEMVIISLFIPGGDIAIIRSEVRYQFDSRASGSSIGNFIGFQFTSVIFKHKKKIRDYIAAKSEAEAELDRDISSRK